MCYNKKKIAGVDMDFQNVTPDDIIYNGRKMKKPDNYFLGGLVSVLLLLAAFLFSAVYTIEPNEVGVVRRFGQFVRITEPGLHFKLPLGIERLNRVRVEYIDKMEFGFRTLSSGVKTQYSTREYDDESLILTGDLNVLDVEWIVQFRIKDPVKFLFSVRDQQKTLMDVSEAVMRSLVGDYAFKEALEKRNELNTLVQQEMQKILDSYDSGIDVVTVKLQDVNPPKPVQPAFNEVNSAKQEMEKMINQAWQVYNQKIPAAKGEALKVISKAEGYAQETVNRATGDADRFTQLLKGYSQSKEITKRRMYLDKMQKIIQKSGKVYIIDPEVKGIVPLLDLTKEKQ